MLQRGFRRAGGSRKNPSVWVFPCGGEPFWKRIEKISRENEFYSPTSDRSIQTLDDLIQDGEARRQKEVRAWLSLPSGAPVDATHAAAFVSLTGTRTRALQSAMLDMIDKTRSSTTIDAVAPSVPDDLAQASRKAAVMVGGRFDVAARDARNRVTGELGERLVLEHERRRLFDAGRRYLSRQVMWTAREEGDGGATTSPASSFPVRLVGWR